MTAFRLTGMRNGVIDDQIGPGDLVIYGEDVNIGQVTTVGNGTLTAATIASGFCRRTGPTGAFTDTYDNSTNILAALAGNSYGAVVVPGSTFRFRHQNNVAFACTMANGTGIVNGPALSSFNVAASSWREYVFKVLNASPPVSMNSNTNTSTAVQFVLPPNASSFPIAGFGATMITPGMGVSGSGVQANTTVVAVTQGQGGIVGVTLSLATTSTVAGTPLAFFPMIQVDSIGAGSA